MTPASRALLRRPHRAWPKGYEEWEQTLGIIEAEARAEALAAGEPAIDAVRVALPAMAETHAGHDLAITDVGIVCVMDGSILIAAIDKEAPEPPATDR